MLNSDHARFEVSLVQDCDGGGSNGMVGVAL